MSLPAATPSAGRRCRCLDTLKDIKFIPQIQHKAEIATGLTLRNIRKLRCLHLLPTCIFCESLHKDYVYTQDARGKEILSDAELSVHFTVSESSLGTIYARCELFTEMKSHQRGSLKGSRSHTLRPIEVVGRFEKPSLEGASGHVVRRLIPSRFDPAILRNWVADCEHNHKHTEVRHDNTSSSLATLVSQGRLRLIDVSTHALIRATNLERYLALSYVWGESHVSRDISLPPSAYAACSGSGSTGYTLHNWDSLPRTIREAADVARSIGERYLWVDALCINQNDLEDQQRLVTEMGSMYGAALVTIISTGAHANSGLPGVNPGSRSGEAYTEASIGSTRIQLVSRLSNLDQELNRSKWSERGWTFQELFLSRRAVVFAPSQVYFTCARGEQAEAYPEGGLFSDKYWQHHIHRQRMPENISSLAAGLIEAYSGRKLTHFRDRFNAFMGVAALQQPDTLSTETVVALRGLPLQYFWHSLLWKHDESRARINQQPMRIKSNLDGSLALPSWSWVGWTGPVSMPSQAAVPSPCPVEAVLLDNANIVLRPTGDAKRFNWEPWPFEPEPYSAKIPNTVTLHMWAPVVDCHLISMEQPKLWSLPRPIVEREGRVPHMIFAASEELRKKFWTGWQGLATILLGRPTSSASSDDQNPTWKSSSIFKFTKWSYFPRKIR